MNPLHRPRRSALVGAVLLGLAAAWFLLVPVTAVYVTSEANAAPHDISSMYSWSTTEQDVIYTDATGADLAHIDEAFLAQPRLTEGIRVSCGTAFSAGSHEKVKPESGQACSEVEGPRRIAGLILLGLAVLGAVLASRLPAESEARRNRYHQPREQRRLLKRGR